MRRGCGTGARGPLSNLREDPGPVTAVVVAGTPRTWTPARCSSSSRSRSRSPVRSGSCGSTDDTELGPRTIRSPGKAVVPMGDLGHFALLRRVRNRHDHQPRATTSVPGGRTGSRKWVAAAGQLGRHSFRVPHPIVSLCASLRHDARSLGFTPRDQTHIAPAEQASGLGAGATFGGRSCRC